MLRILESQAPAKQSATTTISTLCGRLNNATLLEDRRAAILGLRSFARDYPASVASGSLRSLISCLTKDLEDVDTIKVVLETLLMLFKPNPESAEAGDEIALWLADEFTQRQDNVKTLLELLESSDFYSRLYVLQLLSAIYAARPERTQESILSAALGTSRLAATLTDTRDAVRNAGLVFLVELTQSSVDLQKLIAFEGTFEHVLDLLQAEGGLQEGGIIVQDCLDLLANLVRQNSSNQSLFRESGCIAKLAALVRSAYAPIEGDPDAHTLPNSQRDKNLWGLLAVMRLFLVYGSVGTSINQKQFERQGLLQQMLDIAFKESTEEPVRAEALYTCADIIRGNADLQAGFAQHQVPLANQSDAVLTNGVEKVNGTKESAHIYIIDALLDLVIVDSAASFSIRLAACECIKAYFAHHSQIRLHFLNRAIEGFLSGEDETANVLAALMRDGPSNVQDPYKIWFAAVLVLHLVWDDDEAKSTLMKVSEGDADSGEEVVTCVQTLAANLVASMRQEQDERVSIAYLMLLTGLLFEGPEAVDDFLGEASLLQTLVQIVSTAVSSNVVIKGLCSFLIGILYEYSTKDSPISRRNLHLLLNSSLGREKYLQTLGQLRQHPFVRDYEVYEQSSIINSTQELPPYAYFDSLFIEIFRDNFSRLSRAIDRDPGLEVHISAGENGVDRDILDTLRAEIEEKNTIVSTSETKALQLEQKLDQIVANSRKEIETTSAALQHLKQELEAQQKAHAAEVAKIQDQHVKALETNRSASSKETLELQASLVAVRKANTDEAARTKEYYERTIQQGRTAKTNADARLAELKKSSDQQAAELAALKKTHTTLESGAASDKQKHDKLIKDLEKRLKEAETALNRKETAHQSALDKREQEHKASLDKQRAELAAASDAKDKLLNDKFDKKQKAFKAELTKAETALAELRTVSDETAASLREQLKAQVDDLADERTKVAMLEKEVSELDGKAAESERARQEALKEAEEKEEARRKVQAELDDLFLMLQDLEEKRAADKKRLKELGEEVSEDEDGEEDDEDADDDVD